MCETVCMYAICVCLRRSGLGLAIPWNWSSRPLGASLPMWVLRTDL